MKKILELEALQAKVNHQIETLGEANHEDVYRLDALYNSLTPEEEDLVIDRYCGRNNEDDYDAEFEAHIMKIKSHE
jgi:hypothetical protein